jgi:Zn-dependent protease with chaperone function
VVVCIYLPVVCALALAALSRPVARRLPPALAARALTAGLTVITLSTVWAAGLLCVVRLCQVPTIARDSHLAGAVIAAGDPIPQTVSEIAGLILMVIVAISISVTLCRQRATRHLQALASACEAAGDLVVLPVAEPVAVALPGREGKVVVSAGLLRSLDATGRAVLLAHERSHLAHRHDRYTAIAALAAAVNPLLRGVRRDITFALERWADEDAACSIGDRKTVATTLSIAALHAHATPASGLGLAFHREGVVERVWALHTHRPQLRTELLVAGAMPAAVCALAISDSTAAVVRLLATAHG